MNTSITDEDIAIDAIANDDLGNQAATKLQCFRATTIAEVGGLVSSSGAETPAPTGEESIKAVPSNSAMGRAIDGSNKLREIRRNDPTARPSAAELGVPSNHGMGLAIDGANKLRENRLLHRSSYDVIISEMDDALPDLIAIAGVRSF